MADGVRSPTVAIVDDDASVRRALLGLMRSSGIPARVHASAEEFLASGEPARTGCLVSDIRMPGMSGLELQALLEARGLAVPIVFITAHGDAATRARALAAGAIRFLEKPFDDEELLASVRAALGQ